MNKAKWSQEEVNFLIKNYNNFSNKELSNHLNRSISSIRGKADQLRIKISKNWTKEEKDFLIDNYYNKMRTCDIANILNKTYESVNVMASKLGLKKNIDFARRKYSINDLFFSNPSTENCYWAGLLAADGNTYKTKISIKLHIKDIETLEKFKEKIDYTGPVKVYTRQRPDLLIKEQTYCNLYFSSKQIRENLRDIFNISTRKSLNLRPPKLVEKDHIISYIIGYFDGDGHVGIDKKRNRLRFSFIGSKKIIFWIVNNMSSILGVQKVTPRKTGKVWTCIWNKRMDIRNILTSFYNHPISFKMNRKIPHYYLTYIKDSKNAT